MRFAALRRARSVISRERLAADALCQWCCWLFKALAGRRCCRAVAVLDL